MNNQDFQYFNWGTHDDHTQPYYALIDSNRLYLVGQEYQIFKLIQFIVLSSKNLRLLNLSKVPEYTPGLVDNSVCLNWGFDSYRAFDKMGAGFASTYKDPKTITLKNHNVLPSVPHFDFQKNLFLIIELLAKSDAFIRERTSDQVDIDHYKELHNFCKITLPNDMNLPNIIDVDYNSMLGLKNKIENCKNEIIRLLVELDYSTSHDAVVTALRAAIAGLAEQSSIDLDYKKYMLGVI